MYSQLSNNTPLNPLSTKFNPSGQARGDFLYSLEKRVPLFGRGQECVKVDIATTLGRILLVLSLLLFFVGFYTLASGQTISVTVENNKPGSPQLFGLPIPKGELHSPDHVRVLDADGNEIPSQITEVATWEPADGSIKWIWVFFFSGEGNAYTVEYGDGVHNALEYDQRIYVKNNQRSYGEVVVDTGPLRFEINRGGSGFFDRVHLDTAGDGHDESDLIAAGTGGRSSFLDLLDDAGIDSSHAVITNTFKELGSGPLHTIIRVEGEYRYSRDDNNTSPFITRIHAFAGKSYLKVLHTITYTGNPDKHKKIEGEYEEIATEDGEIIEEDSLEGDVGWTQPDDQIESAGLSLRYNFTGDITYRTAYYDGNWWEIESAEPEIVEQTLSSDREISLLQTGPKPSGVPPVPNSSSQEQLTEGYEASLQIGSQGHISAERAPGWIDISDPKWGISIGIRNFFKEYPKEINVLTEDSIAIAYIWSPKTEPMGFVRANSSGRGMLGNFAQGLTKTTELVYNFHKSETSNEELRETVSYILDPTVAHAAPEWYANSEVYGKMSAHSDRYPSLERGLNYKFDWMQFNQHWEPWYGMWDYGDTKAYYYEGNWFEWTNNEPANDFMWWLQFMRTGNPDYYRTARAASRHTMDIDNIHWPRDPEYAGDENESLAFFRTENMAGGSPYVGMGRRHSNQHWTSMLTAHIWNAGWITAYYLDGYHRGLEVAEMTGDYYIKRVFGEHGTTGRRLYLSVWNLAEIWDATKKEKYRKELEYRVNKMLELQKDTDQAGSLVVDRYGYTNVYASNGLRKYYQMTGDERVKDALITHARRVRDLPPFNHDMESYLSSISSLVLGYELSGEESFLNQAKERARHLETDRLPRAFSEYKNQETLANALESVSHLPDDEGGWRPAIWKISNGLRVFGWTHIYNVPWLLYWLDGDDGLAGQ